MVLSIQKMPRKKVGYSIDTRLIEVVKDAARKSGVSANRYLEHLILSHAKSIGALPIDTEPLGETRGGDRTKPEDDK